MLVSVWMLQKWNDTLEPLSVYRWKTMMMMMPYYDDYVYCHSYYYCWKNHRATVSMVSSNDDSYVPHPNHDNNYCYRMTNHECEMDVFVRPISIVCVVVVVVCCVVVPWYAPESLWIWWGLRFWRFCWWW